MFPFEFIIKGIPISFQSKKPKKILKWKNKVRDAAKLSWKPFLPPFTGELEMEIFYFFNGDPPDVDNIIKPIQDALEKLVYDDDKRIVSVKSKKIRIGGSYQLSGISPDVVKSIIEGDDFVYVIIRVPTHPERII